MESTAMDFEKPIESLDSIERLDEVFNGVEAKTDNIGFRAQIKYLPSFHSEFNEETVKMISEEYLLNVPTIIS
ncbi:MAG: hypothetical protein MUF77_10205 [Leptospira sp.]|jgi:hypothetical protein|nr:hypothetical protein [Leptospira sp.]